MSRSMTKAQTALIQAEQNRMIPRFSFTRPESWRFFVADLDTIGLIPSKESGAAEPRGHRDQGAAVSGTRPAKAHLGTRPVLLITPDQQIEDSGLPAPRRVGRQHPLHRGLTGIRPATDPGGWGRNVRVARDSPGSDPPAPR